MKTFNNTAGTTSSEFAIGVGTTGIRQIVLGAICSGTNTYAVDREGNSLDIDGVEFFDLKILAVDQAGNRLTKQLRGTAVAGGSISKIEDTFEEDFDGGVALTISGNALNVECQIGSSTSATYSIYASLQRVS
jgi:hypothetical protein